MNDEHRTRMVETAREHFADPANVEAYREEAADLAGLDGDLPSDEELAARLATNPDLTARIDGFLANPGQGARRERRDP